MTPAQAQAQHRATIVLAQRRAQAAVKNELKRHGRRLVDVEYKEVMAMARDYLDQHSAELMAGAARMSISEAPSAKHRLS